MITPVLLLSLLIPAALVAGVIWLVVWSARRRRENQVRRAAETAYYGWYRVPPNPWLVEVAGQLFPRGEPGEAYAGDFRGRGMCAFDYTYVTSNGKTQSRHTVNLVALNLPVSLPPLTLSHDSGLARAFAGADLELENQGFNDRFRIQCADNRYGSAVLHPRMMECALQNPGLEWRIAGNALVSWGTGGFEVQDLIAKLEAMNRVIDLIPHFVLRDYGQPTYQ